MQVFYSQMCDLIKLGLNGRVFQCPPSVVTLFVGIARFELTTSCSQSRHSNRAELYPEGFLSKASAKIVFFFDIRK